MSFLIRAALIFGGDPKKFDILRRGKLKFKGSDKQKSLRNLAKLGCGDAQSGRFGGYDKRYW